MGHGWSRPQTILRPENTSAVEQTLQSLENARNIVVTGQSGTGKSHGSMVYAIQRLLEQEVAVLFLRYKDGFIHIFLPDTEEHTRFGGDPHQNSEKRCSERTNELFQSSIRLSEGTTSR